MEISSNLALGFPGTLQPMNLVYCFVGALLDTVIGVLPGIGPPATIALLLPITFGLTPEGLLIMLAGIYYGSQYGCSTTAILLKLRGEAASAVTTIDGHQMALKAVPGRRSQPRQPDRSSPGRSNAADRARPPGR